MTSSAMPHPQTKARTGEAGKVRPETPHQRAAAETSQQLSSHNSDSHKSTKQANKKRRQEEAAQVNSNSFADVSHPPVKKAKPNDISNKNTIFDHPATQQNAAVDIQSIHEDSSAIESGIAPGLLENLSYKVTDINIISSSHIQAKVTRILETLASFSFVAPAKPNIVSIHAKASVSSKLITIVEIAKREIAKAGGKWYQYSGLGQTMVTQEKKSAVMKGKGFALRQNAGVDADAMEVDVNEEDQGLDEEESTFETMKTPLERAIEGRPRIRAVPVLTLYLSRVRVESLKTAYGEQTNAAT